MKSLTQSEINKCYSLSDVCHLLNISRNGANSKKVRKLLKNLNLDTTHFGKNPKRFKYKRIIKSCPVCQKKFETLKDNLREKTTCSYSCSNTYFRSGVNNPNWKDSNYRTTCFAFHEKKCVVCGESKLVEVHHLDENKSNSDPFNLIPLCPTHHQYWHSRYKSEVEFIIKEYIDNFIKTSS